MAKYILINRDPWNLSRQKCDPSLPGAGDPLIQPGNGKEYIKPTAGGRDGPCGENTIPFWDDWKKHNATWGQLPRNKKRPNILDQNAKFECLRIILSDYVPACEEPGDYLSCWGPGAIYPNCPTKNKCGHYGNPACCFSKGVCKKRNNKLNLIAGISRNKECDCPDCGAYHISFGINQKLNLFANGMAPALGFDNLSLFI